MTAVRCLTPPASRLPLRRDSIESGGVERGAGGNRLDHIHLTINGYLRYPDMPKKKAQDFVHTLLHSIKMKPLGTLQWSDAEDLEYPGQSYTQMITTSHTSMHIFQHSNGSNEVYFDLYSCKEFDVEKVVKLLEKHFGLMTWSGTLTIRRCGVKPDITLLQSF
jgi:S-adenosylmethionine/arginine decarboxylase-like enzyme